MMNLVRLLALLAIGSASLVCKNADAGPPLRATRAIPLSAGSPANAMSPLGTNLTGVSDYSPEWAFVDAFKGSRAWISSTATTWDDGRPLDLDDNGWVRSLKPGQFARTLMFWDLDGAFPGGEYVVTYAGKGSLEVWPQEVIESAPGRLLVRVDPQKGGLSLIIKETDPADFIRDIRVSFPGTDAKATFHPTFLERLRTYKVLRFMDWTATNDSTVRTWSDRPLMTDARWDKGVPVEMMVELANTLHADPWFTIPHLADDDYVEQLARVIEKKLTKDRLAYVEHSNEVWNAQFGQAKHASNEGKKKELATNDFEAQLRHHSQRSVQIFKIFERVFGGTDRLVRVMGSQAANAWVSTVTLEHDDAYRHTDALAIAPYFGGEFGDPTLRARVAKMTLDELMATLEKDSLGNVRKWMADQSAVAKRFGVSLIAYEGGQHLTGVGPVVDDAAINQLFDAANRDPRMKGLYTSYLKIWQDGGGELFVNFVNTSRSSKWGRWGALESQLQPRAAAPKFDALQTFIEQHPIWWHRK